jgi:hypothetical protein
MPICIDSSKSKTTFYGVNNKLITIRFSTTHSNDRTNVPSHLSKSKKFISEI